MWFRRRRREPHSFDYSTLPEPAPLDPADARDEGVMLAEYAARMQLKNRILVDVVGGTVGFGEGHFRDDARAVLDGLAAEMRAVAVRLAEESGVAAALRGRAQDMHDYRAADLDNLGLREEVAIAVADELTRRRDDDAFLRAFIREARDDAWADVAGAIGDRLDLERPPSAVDEVYERTREERMRLVKNVDLARLEIGRIDY